MTTDLPWMAITAHGTNRVDVIPVADIICHDIVGECPCGPGVVLVDGQQGDVWMHVHPSLDNREANE